MRSSVRLLLIIWAALLLLGVAHLWVQDDVGAFNKSSACALPQVYLGLHSESTIEIVGEAVVACVVALHVEPLTLREGPRDVDRERGPPSMS